MTFLPHARPQLRNVVGLLTGTANGLAEPFIAPVLHTDRLTLRPYLKSDESDWLRIENDVTIRTGLGWPDRTPHEARVHLHSRTLHTSLQYPGDFLVLAIEHDHHVIGDVSLHLRTSAPETRMVEIGWLLLSSESGSGFATEAAQALLGVAFCDLDSIVVTAVTRHENTSSARLAARLGFNPAGSTTEHATFLLTASQWKNSHETARGTHDDNIWDTRQ